jgi:methionyl aminopeptidase
MVQTTEKALLAAISTIKAGINVGDVGKVISSVITRAGFKPISNLTGHSMARYALHSGTSVPNIPMQVHHVMSEGEVYAIEPFATKASGKGFVKEAKSAFIYSCHGEAPLTGRSDAPETALLNELKTRFNTLPFAIRWLDDGIDLRKLGKLVKKGLVLAYPVLVEAGKKLVAQSEHTLIVRKHDCKVLTT